MTRLTALLVSALLLFSLSACGQAPSLVGETTPTGETPPAASQGEAPESPETPEPPATPEAPPESPAAPESPAFDPASVEWVNWDGPVEHLFFHPLIAYPELAFDGDAQANGLDDWMITVGEYDKILQSVYEKGFVLVDINQIWEETTDAAGKPVMVRSELKVPAGKKPLVLSYDDVNYYPYMLKNGFTYKLILGEDGQLWSQGKDPQGNEVLSQDLDAVTILDKFVREHPDFSPYGAKGCLSLTGYCGILGYRTMTEKEDQSAAHEANRQREIEAARPIVAALKATGWTFGSHTWGHINLSSKPMKTIQADYQRWMDEVGSLVGPTTILFYPHGARPDGGDWHQTGPVFQFLQSKGYRVFCSVGTSSFSYIKEDICAVICDRLHPDGTTLRSAKARERYLPFYDAKDIIDLTVRPQRPVGWQ
ncbi:MAG: polysaccharide deacetylase family protein [Oscillibacter sp.]